MVRIKDNGMLAMVIDSDWEIEGDRDDPACVREVRLFDSEAPYEEWMREEYFVSDLVEVVEALGPERMLACQDFDYIVMNSAWTEDTPPERDYYVWVVREDEGASVWLRRGILGDPEAVGAMSEGQVVLLRHSIVGAELRKWRRDYPYKGSCIGCHAWGIELIQGTRVVSVGGIDGYDARLEALCKAMRKLGVPVEFWGGHGLAYSSLERRKRRRQRRRASA